MAPSQLIRRNETDFKRLQLDATMVTEQQLLDAMVMHPALIERPIVVVGDKAVIGRPPENVLGLL